ncbi:hypothetical protein FQA39_LY17642 [Lamprigera yunnana]|nr:hypothetical protein FQA39_LY17642 [Lamprigera yunnana]
MSDYNPAEEARLLQYNNASNEVLVDVTRYALDGDADKYVYQNGVYGGCQAFLHKNSVLLTVEEWKTLMGLESHLTHQFFRNSIEIQHILEQSFKDDISVHNISRPGDISTDIKTYYNWEHTKGLSSSSMTKTLSAARNRDDAEGILPQFGRVCNPSKI